ncbi:polyphosphate kinase 2 family protein [Marinobacterium jannaschii]|uniref:polyphosphate kinase 2 family protein n=1 Tax=Marinobacterium jannaschii TaxID=64970 RepID=UPI000487D6DD|nr:polyphosphate kinase [Marinobacterium jannaschii]
MYQPSTIQFPDTAPCLDYEMLQHTRLPDKDSYQKTLKKLQKRMLQVQQAYHQQGHRAIIVFEGWDASGKGGAIRRLTEKLDPRGFRVHPIAAPEADEQSKHYLYRFQKRLPNAGSFAIFDRSWYGRVLVERIEGFASKPEWQRAYQEINEYERMLSDDGVRIIKLFLHIDPDEQLSRFEERLNNPIKHWKLTPEDIRNRSRWAEYEQASNEMFRHTSTLNNPWQIIAANHKWSARIEVLRYVTDRLAEDIDITPAPLDPEVIRQACEQLGIRPR